MPAQVGIKITPPENDGISNQIVPIKQKGKRFLILLILIPGLISGFPESLRSSTKLTVILLYTIANYRKEGEKSKLCVFPHSTPSYRLILKRSTS